jgi:hypothetical protein
MALAAQQESEHQRRMSNDRLHAKRISTKTFETKALVCFYKPPTQAQALATGRKVKHLAHYWGPATVTSYLGRSAYKLAFEGKAFQRDAGMIFPYSPTPADLPWQEEAPKQKPSFHKLSVGHQAGFARIGGRINAAGFKSIFFGLKAGSGSGGFGLGATWLVGLI